MRIILSSRFQVDRKQDNHFFLHQAPNPWHLRSNSYHLSDISSLQCRLHIIGHRIPLKATKFLLSMSGEAYCIDGGHLIGVFEGP